MKLKIRNDGRFDVFYKGFNQKALDKKTAGFILSEYGITKERMSEALEHRNFEDNCLHFGINRTFMFSTYEPENE